MLRILPPSFLVAAAALLPTHPAQAQKSLVLRVGSAQVDPKQQSKNPAFLIENGKIADVELRSTAKGRSSFEGQGRRVLSFEDAVLTAGFIDLHSTLGAAGELAEQVDSFHPELDAGLAYDPAYPGWKRLLARGVTSIALSPDDRNLVGGVARLLPAGAPGVKLGEESYLKFSLTKEMLNSERRPTSLIGAADYLREKYEELQSPKNPQPLAKRDRGMLRFAQTVGGSWLVGLSCRSSAEIQSALELVRAQQMTAFLIHANDADRCLPELRGARLPIALDTLTLGSSKRALELPAKLAQKKIPVCFVGESAARSGPSRFQQSMALAIRHGMDPAAALAAVTTVPAQILGVEDQYGSIYRGRAADLIVWTRDPRDLRARILAVMRAGRLVYEAKLEPSKATSSDRKSQGNR